MGGPVRPCRVYRVKEERGGYETCGRGGLLFLKPKKGGKRKDDE